MKNGISTHTSFPYSTSPSLPGRAMISGAGLVEKVREINPDCPRSNTEISHILAQAIQCIDSSHRPISVAYVGRPTVSMAGSYPVQKAPALYDVDSAKVDEIVQAVSILAPLL